MEFIFNGSLAELMEQLPNCGRERYRELPYSYEQGVLEIGFLRLSRKKGRYFVADVTDRGDTVLLDGKFTNKSKPFPRMATMIRLRQIGVGLLGFLLFYITLGVVPWVLWWALKVPHVWIALVLPALPIIPFLFPYGINRNYDYEDEEFCLFMEALCGSGHPVPTDTRALYEMLLHTQDLHSVPKLNKDEIIWELYEKVTVKAGIMKNSTLIEIHRNGPLQTSFMHWHPEPEKIYRELCMLGRKGHILVLRKSLFGTQTFYYGHPGGYELPKKRKYHWGRLIYLEQK